MSNWSKASESWNAAGIRARNYRAPKPRVMMGPIGVALTFEAEGLSGEIACEGCGHHRCNCEPPDSSEMTCRCGHAGCLSCDTPEQAMRADQRESRAFKIGDRVRGIVNKWTGTVVEIGPVYVRGDNGVLFVEGDGLELLPVAPAESTPGTFEWLKTLPPDTRVRRDCWKPGTQFLVRTVLADQRQERFGWRTATGWVLA